jgi:uncharacterized repeat protein (TIGR02543 family)
VQDANYAGTADGTLTILDVFTLATVAVNGTASGGGDYTEGTTAQVEAVPDPGYLFTGWAGDATGTGNPLTVVMDADRTIIANFSPDLADNDGDGLSNHAEIVIHGSSPDLIDTDGDGLEDGYEVGVGRFRTVWGMFRWEQARLDAMAQGGHLATFTSQQEWDAALAGLEEDPFPFCTGLWIGATDAAVEGVWEWITGEPFGFNLWAAGQPNNSPGEQDVAEVSGWWGAAPGLWADTSSLAVREGYLLETGWSTDPAKADTDGDGFLDGMEVEFGGNPLVAAIVPVVPPRLAASPDGATVQFQFMTRLGDTYAIETSTNLVDWEAAETGISGTGGIVVREYPTAGWPQRFFRASTLPAPVAGVALIPAGSFIMGDQSDPQVGNSDELPAHTVQVSAFYMGKYEVTKEEWDAVRAWGLNRGYTDLAVGNGGNPSKGANHPVHYVNWHDVVKWCNARSEMEGLTPCYTVAGTTYRTGQIVPDCDWSANGYRLPTEAEWEKAARGGAVGKNFPWGTDTISHSQANYYSSSSYSYDVSPTRGYHPTYGTGSFPYSSPVGSFAPNGYGLYDMAGNMWEWVWDWAGPYSAAPQTDPRGATSGSHRVRRGGSCYYDAFSLRAAHRSYRYPTASSNGNGFRLARSSVP